MPAKINLFWVGVLCATVTVHRSRSHSSLFFSFSLLSSWSFAHLHRPNVCVCVCRCQRNHHHRGCHIVSSASNWIISKLSWNLLLSFGFLHCLLVLLLLLLLRDPISQKVSSCLLLMFSKIFCKNIKYNMIPLVQVDFVAFVRLNVFCFSVVSFLQFHLHLLDRLSRNKFFFVFGTEKKRHISKTQNISGITKNFAVERHRHAMALNISAVDDCCCADWPNQNPKNKKQIFPCIRFLSCVL